MIAKYKNGSHPRYLRLKIVCGTVPFVISKHSPVRLFLASRLLDFLAFQAQFP